MLIHVLHVYHKNDMAMRLHDAFTQLLQYIGEEHGYTKETGVNNWRQKTENRRYRRRNNDGTTPC